MISAGPGTNIQLVVGEIVAAFRLSPLFVCHRFSFVTAFRLSPLFVCHRFSFVTAFRLSPLFACYRFSFVTVFRLSPFFRLSHLFVCQSCGFSTL
jgi:hypothetical protein